MLYRERGFEKHLSGILQATSQIMTGTAVP